MTAPATPSSASPTPSLSDWLRAALDRTRDRALVVGVAGLPGCGKSTWAREFAAQSGVASLAVSLDDFYLEPAQRKARGFARRGPPGTHDLSRLATFVAQVRAPNTAPVHIDVPVFDRDAERRLPAQPRHFPVDAPLRLCIVEGWFVGARAPGYEPLADDLDRLIYLDMDEADARAARLSREAERRAAGQPAMSATETERFWAEALAPGFATWVYPLRDRADVVLTLDAQHQTTALRLRTRTD